MISVTIELYDSEELALVHQLASILEQKRQKQAAENHAAMQGAEDAADLAAINAAEERAALHAAYGPQTDATKPVEPEAPVATITGPGTAIKLSDMEAAAQKAIQTGGLAAVRAIVNEYGKSRIREIDAGLWPEVLAKLANVKPLAAAE